MKRVWVVLLAVVAAAGCGSTDVDQPAWFLRDDRQIGGPGIDPATTSIAFSDVSVGHCESDKQLLSISIASALLESHAHDEKDVLWFAHDPSNRTGLFPNRPRWIGSPPSSATPTGITSDSGWTITASDDGAVLYLQGHSSSDARLFRLVADPVQCS